jgi:chromosome segregation ATPase
VCAFEKDAAQRAKVDGLVLCFLCTRKYKRRRHDEERKGSAATPAEWSAKCDALQRELAALKKAHAVELKKMAADTSALVTPLTATLEQARRDEHQKARELKDLDRQYGALASEAHTLEKRLRGLQNEHNDLTALCAQLTLELATLGDKVAPVKPEPVNKAVSSSNAFVRREESR